MVIRPLEIEHDVVAAAQHLGLAQFEGVVVFVQHGRHVPAQQPQVGRARRAASCGTACSMSTESQGSTMVRSGMPRKIAMSSVAWWRGRTRWSGPAGRRRR